ncbi:MAG: SWIM zinc finger family protein [Acidobacteriota bacterium]
MARRSPRKRRFGEKWWSGLWIKALESFGWASRLQRGRSYARDGQVVKLTVEPGHIQGLVQGSRAEPYKVEIRLQVIPIREWRRVIYIMAQRASFAAKLLAGEMPQNIEKAFEQARIPLLPRHERDFDSTCTCPDRINPCKHIAAVHYIAADEFDHDPFMIFQLRGMPKESLLEALRERRGGRRHGHPDGQEDGALPADPEVFWRPGPRLGQFTVDIRAPEVETAVLKRLGKPRFWRDPSDFDALMLDLYRNVTRNALDMASREGAAEEDTDRADKRKPGEVSILTAERVES